MGSVCSDDLIVISNTYMSKFFLYSTVLVGRLISDSQGKNINLRVIFDVYNSYSSVSTA